MSLCIRHNDNQIDTHVRDREWAARNIISLLHHCFFFVFFLLMSDLDLRGSRHLRQGPEVCELCQAGDCRSLSHEPGRDGERRRWPHSSRSQSVDFSLWGRAGRWNELCDFILRSAKLKQSEGQSFSTEQNLMGCICCGEKRQWTGWHVCKNDVMQIRQ